MDISTIETLIAALIGMGTGFALISIFQRSRLKRVALYVHSSQADDDRFTPTFGVVISDWKSCFAWWPVLTIDEGLIWLRHYWRRRIRKKSQLDGPDWRSYQRVAMLRYSPDNGRRVDPELWP